MLQIKSRPRPQASPSGGGDEQLTQRASHLMDQGEYAQAYPLLDRVAGQQNTVQAHMVAGLVAMQLHDHAAASRHFDEAVAGAPDDFDANYNSALLEIMRGQHRKALSRLLHLRRRHPENAKLLNDIAIVWSERNSPARALAAFGRALRLAPNDSETRNNAMQYCLERRLYTQALRLLGRQENLDVLNARSRAEIGRWSQVLRDADAPVVATPHLPVRDVLKNRSIAVFATHQMFIRDIMSSLGQRNRIRHFEGKTIDQMRELMVWADVAWFEWCDQLLIEATKLPKTCRIVCRLHSYEVFTDMPARVDWSKVDHLVFVNESVRDLFLGQVKTPVKTSVIYNGVDLERFALPEHKPASKKIASVGYINYKKNPALLLYCFAKIHAHDPEYTLHVAGEHQDPRIELYFRNFLQRHPLPVHFHGWVDDMPKWYADKGYVISTSLFESFHYSIAEGMACGLLPLIHDWYGADNLYPSKHLFGDPDDCLRLLRRLEGGDLMEMRRRNRRHIEARFNGLDKTADIAALLARVADMPIVSGHGEQAR